MKKSCGRLCPSFGTCGQKKWAEWPKVKSKVGSETAVFGLEIDQILPFLAVFAPTNTTL
jgi:hypothetical protein